MFMSKLRNEKGVTLIELLAALVILTIVLTGFFGVFIQSAKFQNMNESNTVATNLARLVLEDVRQMDGTTSIGAGSYQDFNNVHTPPISTVNEHGQFIEYPSHYLILHLEEEPNSELLKVTIEIYNDHGLASKTYDYIEVSS